MVYCAQKRYIFVRPHWIQHLNAFRVEAAWKLGQWGDLEQCLKAVCKTGLFCEICMLNIELFQESSSSKNWDVNMGWLLLAAKQKVIQVSSFNAFYVSGNENQNSFSFYVHMSLLTSFFRTYLVLSNSCLGLELNRWLHSQLQVQNKVPTRGDMNTLSGTSYYVNAECLHLFSITNTLVQ